MGKKSPHFSKMVCEALSTADDEKGMNAKMILDFIKQRHPLGHDDKSNLDFICKELERGKAEKEYLQVQGNSVHGTFTFNCFYVPPNECQPKGLPDYLNPPEPPKEPVQALEPKKKRKPRKDKEKETQDNESPKGGRVLLRYSANGKVEKCELDKSGNMKFSLFEPMPRLSKLQRNQVFSMSKTKEETMDPERAAKLASDPLFRRVYSQTNSINIDPALQDAVNAASLGKKKSLLRGDKTDSLRLGNHSHAHEISEDDNRMEESCQSASQKKKRSTVDLIHHELSKLSIEPELHPKVKQLMKQGGTIYGYINDLKSSNSKRRLIALHGLFHEVQGTDHQLNAIVELGGIPTIIACISESDLDCSGVAMGNLLLLCKSSDFCKLMFEAHVGDKLLALAMNKNFKSKTDEWQGMQAQIFSVLLPLAQTLTEHKWKIEMAELHNLLNLIIEMIGVAIADIVFIGLFQMLCMLLVMFLSEEPEYVWRFKFADEKIEFFYSKLGGADVEKNSDLVRFCRLLLIKDGMKYVPFLAKLGFVDKLVQLLGCKNLTTMVLGCFKHVVDEHVDGYKHIYDANVVPKILPLIKSGDKELRKSSSEVFASLVETKYSLLAPHLNMVQILKLCKNFEEFRLLNDDLEEKFAKLYAQVKKQCERGLKKTARKLVRKH